MMPYTSSKIVIKIKNNHNAFTNFAPQVDLDEAASSKYADAEGLVTKAEFVRLGKNDLTTNCNPIDRHVFQQKNIRQSDM